MWFLKYSPGTSKHIPNGMEKDAKHVDANISTKNTRKKRKLKSKSKKNRFSQLFIL
jgi:hypothetical protein